MYAHRLLFTNANHDEDNDRDEEQDVWSSTIPRYSTNGLQMPGSDVALGNSKRKKKKKQVPCSQEAYSQGMGQKISTQEELKTVT